MCGRYTITNSGQLSLRFAAQPAGEASQAAPRYNVAPTQPVPVVRALADGRVLGEMRWGLRPPWMAEGRSAAPINARAETLLQRPLFRNLVPGRRCLLPADGFYEWQDTGAKHKQPYYIRLRDGSLFAFAGLYSEGSADGGVPASCVLITTVPNELMVPIHDRMPAILRPEDEAAWLDPDLRTPELALGLLRPYPTELMEAYPVSSRVSSARHEGPDLIQPLN